MAISEREAVKKMKDKRRNENWEERKERSKLSREEIAVLEVKRSQLRQKLEEAEGNAVETKVDEKQEEERFNINDDNAESLAFSEFRQLPLSQRTLLGLERGRYHKMTLIQQDSLHLALAGFDVLGAAKTGSGKTLCFVIPVLEQLFLQHWSPDMGVGAIILTPTRELALQIFKVAQLVGYKHVISAALLTGGRDVNEEKKRLHAISIIIGTPGRILHHLQDTSDLVLDNLQILCMDEADRLLDMGFRDSIANILKYLPTDRQTLLYSATQTTNLEMLALMALRNPRYVTSFANSKTPTPSTLCQNFFVVELHRKLDALLAFLKKHPNDKVVVFASTCNQVKYMYLTFSKILKKMRIPSMCLTGKMKQFRREEVFMTFCRCKSAALFSTDVGARGLDFPLVHWVIQFDCPDSAATYIHRVGRTARAGARGAAVLFLTPSETPFLSYLAHKNVPMREITIRPQLLQVSREIFVALVVQGLKYAAQKAFIAYIRSVFFSANKHVFDINSIDTEAFARSLGLPAVPDMSDLDFRRSAKNLPWSMINFLQEAAGKSSKSTLNRKEKHLQASDMFRKLQQEQKYAPKHGKRLDNDVDESDEDVDEDFLVKKEVTKPLKAVVDRETNQATEKHQRSLTAEERMAGLSKHKIRKYIESADLRVRDLGLNQRIVFDSEEDESDDDEVKNKGNDLEAESINEGQQDSMAFQHSTTSCDEKKLLKSKKNAAKAAETAAFTQQTYSSTSAKHKKGEKGEEAEDDSELEDSVDFPVEGEDYVHQLRQHLQQQKTTDVDRAKQLRRIRKLQKAGKLSKKATLGEGNVASRNISQYPEERYDEERKKSGYDSVHLQSSSDDESGSDESLLDLMALAKDQYGAQRRKDEVYSHSDNTDGDYCPLDEEDGEMPRKKTKKDKKTK